MSLSFGIDAFERQSYQLRITSARFWGFTMQGFPRSPLAKFLGNFTEGLLKAALL